MTDEERSLWLRERWSEKEKLLTEFNIKKKFPETLKDTPQVSNILTFTLLFWTISFSTTVYFMCVSSPIRWFILFGLSAQALLSYLGGIDNLERYFHTVNKNN